MTNLPSLICLFTIFNGSLGFQSTCPVVDEILMLPAPKDVYHKEKLVEFSPNATVSLPVSMVVSDSDFFGNITMRSALDTQKQLISEAFDENSFHFEEDSQGLDDEIHLRSLKIAGFVAQCLVFLFVFTMISLDVDQFDENENGEFVVRKMHKLYRAREIQNCPLPARQNVKFIRHESEC